MDSGSKLLSSSGLQHLRASGHPKDLRLVLLDLVVSTGGTQCLQPVGSLRRHWPMAGATQGPSRTTMKQTMMSLAT